MPTAPRVVAGALIGGIATSAAVWVVAALAHWLKFRDWSEFWGVLLAIRAIPVGLLLGATLGYLSKKLGWF